MTGLRKLRGRVISGTTCYDAVGPCGMTSDTKWIIGTIVPAILVVAGLLSVQISGVNARIDDLNSRLERLETDVRSMDDRLRSVEAAFGKVDQRLETLERAIVPAAAPAE